MVAEFSVLTLPVGTVNGTPVAKTNTELNVHVFVSW